MSVIGLSVIRDQQSISNSNNQIEIFQDYSANSFIAHNLWQNEKF